MRVAQCDFCDGSSTKLVYVLRDLQLGLPGEFRLVRCEECGLLYLNPQPTWDELKHYYPDWYDSFLQGRSSHLSTIQRYGITRRCRTVSKYRASGRLLDVGCAAGVFLNEMKHYGEWELYGVDPSIFPARVARERFGLQAFQGTLMEANFPDDYFDVVTWWDVLEHVPNPSACLSETKRILRPGGWVFIQTPDPLSWEARLFGAYWRGFEAPRHLYLFSRSVLVRRLTDLGFEVKQAKSFAGNLSTALSSLGYWLDSQGLKKAGNLTKVLTRSTLTRVVGAPFAFLLRFLGRSFSLLYIAQKPLGEVRPV